MLYRATSVRAAVHDGDRAEGWRSKGFPAASCPRYLTLAGVRSSASATHLPALFSLPPLRRNPAAPQSRAMPVS